jgi:myo-inositol-1(or 4)-monophosphatase
MQETKKPIAAGQTEQQRVADLRLLIEAVREAGELALSFFCQSPHTELKADGSEVSEADLAVDACLKRSLIGERPDYGWLSEESEDDPSRLEKRFVWVVDPIDGTRAFLRDKPEWAVSVALVDRNHPVLAAIFNGATGEFFHASLGHGAFLNDNPIRVNDPVELEGSRLAAAPQIFKRDIWRQPWPKLETIWVNSIAYRLALAASAQCDGTLSMSGKNDWDIVAGQLLVEEAGGVMTTARGGPLVYNQLTPAQESIVAAGSSLHAALLQRTKAALS